MLKDDDAKSLAEGIEQFLNNNNPEYKEFDIESYNNLALSQFNNLFN
ncbi:hypothetical protein ACY2C7_09870 [Staphylococcus cohnii]